MFSPRRTLSAVSTSPHYKMAATLCVLGVDPAVAGATGYGVVESDGRRCRMLRFGALRPALARGSGGTRSRRDLRDIHALIADLIQEFAPDGVAVESVFTALNVKTALRLAEVRGVILLAAAQAGVAEFQLLAARSEGHRRGLWPRGQRAGAADGARRPRNERNARAADAADALAVALCHVQMAESQQRLAANSAVVSAASRFPPPQPSGGPAHPFRVMSRHERTR